jgi:hypothetical protein
MKYLKYYEYLIQNPIQVGYPDIPTSISKTLVEPDHIYEVNWKDFAPKNLVLIKGDITDSNGYLLDRKTGKPTNQLCKYKQSNIMADLMMQVTYERDFDVLGIPDTLEFDMTILNPKDDNFEMSIEITFGDMVASGFEIQKPNKIKVHHYTSFGSKADPSNTVFGFTETSLNKLIRFFNHFDGLRVTRADLNFLDNNQNNYRPD